MAERIRQAGQTHSMELIFFPLIILILIGLISNAFSSSAIQTVPALPPNPGAFCTGNIEPGECYPTNVNGCDSSINPQCNFTSKTTFSFLNANSPFTILLQGNILGFFATVFNQGEGANQINSGYTICIPLITKIYSNASGSDIHDFQCQGFVATGAGNHPFPVTGIPLNASSNDGNNSQWTINGCKLITPTTYDACILNYGNGIASFNGTHAESNFYGFYIKNGTILTSSGTCNIASSAVNCLKALPYLFHTNSNFQCPSTQHINGLNINATTYYCLLPTINPLIPTTSDTSNSLGNSFGALGFIFGMILFFLGFGFALSSALIGFSVNEQGTKLAQVIGIGLVIWTFIYSEFGGWLTSLPFNLNFITFTIFTTMFFLGLYWRTFSTLD